MATHQNDKGSFGPSDEGAVATESEQRVQRPPLYSVLVHNDDYTTMEFVVMVLMQVFHHSEPKAAQIMLQVHQKGIGVAGIYTYEIAESRIAKVERLAKEHEFPLRCTMQPE